MTATTMPGPGDATVARRRAIEALRSGVPSRDAVAALGSGQTAIEDRFATLRESASSGAPGGLDVAGLQRLGATRMRPYVRAWINEWDLVRLDPTYRPDTEAVDVTYDYRGDESLDEEEPVHEPDEQRAASGSPETPSPAALRSQPAARVGVPGAATRAGGSPPESRGQLRARSSSCPLPALSPSRPSACDYLPRDRYHNGAGPHPGPGMPRSDLEKLDRRHPLRPDRHRALQHLLAQGQLLVA